MQKSLNITQGCFPYGNKIHIIILGKKLIVTDSVRMGFNLMNTLPVLRLHTS